MVSSHGNLPKELLVEIRELGGLYFRKQQTELGEAEVWGLPLTFVNVVSF